ncbi:MAG: tail fiber domain-containing protein [Candidatus Sulfotelmatobacter sp.]
MKLESAYLAAAVLCFATMASAQDITGSGTTHYIPTFTGTTTVGDSRIYQDSAGTGINTTAPAATLDVNGNINSATGYKLGGDLFAFGSAAKENAFFGFAGNATMTGTWNTASGYKALAKNTTGYNNAAVGDGALSSNTAGVYNAAIGVVALQSNTTGSYNTASGGAALGDNTTGFYNTAIGNLALPFSTTGISNTAVGNTALFGNKRGNYNTAIGESAMVNNSTGSNNTALGSSAGPASANLSNSTALGAFATVSQSNSLVLGSVNGVNGAISNVKVGIATTTPSNIFTIGQGAGEAIADSWDIYSSRRFKTNIHPLLGALDKVEQLEGVSYDRKSDGKSEIGVIAEDVAQVVPEIVSRNPRTDEVQGVDYSRLAALLIEAVKSQQAEINSQRAEIDQLKKQLQQLTTKK